MKLYYAPGACSLAVHIALRETGADFETVAVDLSRHETADGRDYRAVSPRGYVPLLELDDGSRHTEVSALLQRIADAQPGRPLIGEPGSARRGAVTEWIGFVATELHRSFSPWLWHKDTAESTRRSVKATLAARFAELEALLGRQDHLAGDYSVADAYAYTILNWTRFLAMPLSAHPHLEAYLARIADRPAVQQALRAEGLLR